MANRKGIGGHQSSNAGTHQWITPLRIIKSLGEFDLDPCAPASRPWDTAKNHFTEKENGLLMPWFGRVWLNPPYGNYLNAWMEKMAQYREGIAMIFARTDTQTFHKHIFPVADSLLFLEGRITFCNIKGEPAKYNGGAPSVLIAYGDRNVEALNDCQMPGKHVLLNRIPVMVIGFLPSWKHVVSISLVKLGGQASVQQVYELVEKFYPEKLQKNKFYKEKIRQSLQLNFERLQRGIYKVA